MMYFNTDNYREKIMRAEALFRNQRMTITPQLRSLIADLLIEGYYIKRDEKRSFDGMYFRPPEGLDHFLNYVRVYKDQGKVPDTEQLGQVRVELSDPEPCG